VLHIACSGYYAWARATANKALTDQVAPIHERNRHSYGMPRVHALATQT